MIECNVKETDTHIILDVLDNYSNKYHRVSFSLGRIAPETPVANKCFVNTGYCTTSYTWHNWLMVEDNAIRDTIVRMPDTYALEMIAEHIQVPGT